MILCVEGTFVQKMHRLRLWNEARSQETEFRIQECYSVLSWDRSNNLVSEKLNTVFLNLINQRIIAIE